MEPESAPPTAPISTAVEIGVAQSPGVTVQQVYMADTVPPPATYQRHTWVDQGTGDIDRERYWSPEFHRLEVERMWRRVWQVACREEDIPKLGDHVVYDIADDSLIVVRSGPDTIRAFHNSCLHRGSALRDKPGRVPRFVCPFHGWTWNLDGVLVNLPAAWDFPHVDRERARLPEAHVACWGGFVFVNMAERPEPLLDYLEVLPAELAAHPLEHRWKSVHVRKVVACNWKVASEAFAESYHVVRTHPQAMPFSGDVNAQYDLWPGVRHVSRMITLLGIASPLLAEQDDELIVRALRTPGDMTERPRSATPRQFSAERHREHYSQRFGVDLAGFSDAEILDAIQYHVFPNFSPWSGVGQPVQYVWRPNGNDPETSVMDVMFLQPLGEGQERPPAAEVHELAPDEPWTNARELGKYAPVFVQDEANFSRVQRGIKAGRKGNTLAVYQESKIRHFHRTLDHYLGLAPSGGE
jgi:phenylpropionate dioxygenase-like ring-hydroxylating dioxygenase large terminal subunit